MIIMLLQMILNPRHAVYLINEDVTDLIKYIPDLV